MQANWRLASQSTKYPTSRKRCFIALSSCGVVRASCKKRTCGDSILRSSKKILAVPSRRPDVPGQQRKGGIRIFHLSTAQTSLEADTMLDSHVALYWRVSLGSVPSSSQSKWSANPLQDHHNWQCTKDHSGTSNPQLSSKAEDETDRCGAIVTNSTTMRRVGARAEAIFQPLVSLSTDVHILACVHSTRAIRSSREFFTAASHLCFRKSSRTSVFSVCNTLPCAQACCFASSHARGDSSGTHHPQSGQDQSNAFVRRRQTSISLVQPRALAQHGISQNQSF